MTCDRVIIIHEGSLVAVDTPENLIKRLQEAPIVLVKAEAPPEKIIPALKSISEVIEVEEITIAADAAGFYRVKTAAGSDIANDIARTIFDNGWRLKEIRPFDMSLEDIFIKLVTEEKGTDR